MFNSQRLGISYTDILSYTELLSYGVASSVQKHGKSGHVRIKTEK